MNTQRTRVKICGLTRIEDVRCAVEQGADAIGLVFYAPSPRAVNTEQAALLIKAITPFVQAVGLFVDAKISEIEQVLAMAKLDVLQLHGNESPELCREIGLQTGRRWIKALAVKPDCDIEALIKSYIEAGASGILLDTWHPQLKGGTGQSFDWSLWPKLEIPLILAGGLTPDNVAQAIAQTHPYAVDVSGGVEVGPDPKDKGIKDHQLIQKFMQGVHFGNPIG